MRILAAVDETSDGLEPARVAARFVLRPTDEIVTICVTAPRIVAYGMGTGTGPAPGSMYVVLPPSEVASGGLPVSVASTLEGAACTRRAVVLEGAPERVMPEAMGEVAADLVILPATQPRNRLEALVFGDPWGPAIAAATVPVLLARPGRAGPMNLLVVLDDPRQGADAVRAITTLPVPSDARVLLLGLVAAGTHAGAVRQRQRMVRRTDVAMRMLRRSGLRTATVLRHGHGATDILAAAESIDADVIVLGARHERGGRPLDKVARSIVGGAPCSVLLVPAGAERRRRRPQDDDERWTVTVPGASSPEVRI